MDIPASKTQQVVAVLLPGVHVLMFTCDPCEINVGHVRLTVDNGWDLYNGPAVTSSHMLALYASGGEQLRHDGCACSLFGTRLGNEL